MRILSVEIKCFSSGFASISGEKPDSNKENNNVSNGDKSRRGSNASRDRSDSRENQRSRSKDKGAAAGKNKRSSSKDSKAASRESTASNGRAIDKGCKLPEINYLIYFWI